MTPNQVLNAEKASAWDKESVSKFYDGHDDILVLDRSTLIALDPAVVAAGRIHEFQAPVDRQRAGFEVRSGLKEGRLNSSERSTDIIRVVNAFLDQFELPEAKLRIELTQTQSCPKFHSDNLDVRLVTTYFGPTTEFQQVGENTVRIAPLGGLVFLKGRQHPAFRDTVHHRSPEVPAGQRRLCVAIDY